MKTSATLPAEGETPEKVSLGERVTGSRRRFQSPNMSPGCGEPSLYSQVLMPSFSKRCNNVAHIVLLLPRQPSRSGNFSLPGADFTSTAVPAALQTAPPTVPSLHCEGGRTDGQADGWRRRARVCPLGRVPHEQSEPGQSH